MSVCTSFGLFVPPHIISNEALCEGRGKTPEWIVAKSGIQERRYALTETTAEMAVMAIQDCLTKAQLSIDDIDCLILATVTADYYFPSTAAFVLKMLCAQRCWGFDISAACAGFVYGLQLANAMLCAGDAKRILVCGVDKMSTMADPNDIPSRVIFGDGAGVVLVESESDKQGAIIKQILCGMNTNGLYEIYSQSSCPADEKPSPYMYMEGKAVFAHGVEAMCKAAKTLLDHNLLTGADIDWFVPHQSNLRMMELVADGLHIRREQMIITVNHWGNTVAASVPMALAGASQSFRAGERILITTVGSGYAYGACLLQWN